MALSNSWYDSIMREYQNKRLQADLEASKRKDYIYSLNPALDKIDSDIATASVEAARLALGGDRTYLDKLQDKVSLLKHNKEEILSRLGYSFSDLQPRYQCKDCNDTGYIGSDKCHCLRQSELDKIYELSRLSDILDKENFNNFNLDYYSKDKVNDDGISSYDNANRILHKCIDFSDNYTGQNNLLLYGPPGVGKTYLTHCIADRLLSQMHSVIYLTAAELVKAFEDETFNKDESNLLDNELIFDVDVLIIDDLGTEFVNSFTSSKLFTCINERLLRMRSTVISTNLSLQELLETYSERTFSRISKFTILKLFGDDIRIMSRAQGSTR